MINRFSDKISKGKYCWEWMGARTKKGYGVFCATKRIRITAHRASWVFHRGEIPNGLHVLHKCDNPACVNPTHLFIGTNADNVADKLAKGRQPSNAKEKNPMWRNYKAAARGAKVGGSKLNDEQVREIRKENKSGISQISLAKKYGVTQANIWGIVHDRTWTHI